MWRLLRLFERMTFAAADVSIATNESYRTIAVQRGDMSAEKVTVVRSAPDLTQFTLLPPNPRWRNGRRHLVGYVGVMGEQEGLDLLLDAIGIIVGHGREDVQFCLVGSGSSLPELRRLCARKGLDPYVTFTGRASDDDLFEMLATADICVNSDRVNAMNDKSTMNKIMEYMAFGKPIVQFDVAEGRVSAGEASLYARPNDSADLAAKIESLLEGDEKRAWMGQVGLKRMDADLAWGASGPQAHRRLSAALPTRRRRGLVHARRDDWDRLCRSGFRRVLSPTSATPSPASTMTSARSNGFAPASCRFTSRAWTRS